MAGLGRHVAERQNIGKVWKGRNASETNGVLWFGTALRGEAIPDNSRRNVTVNYGADGNGLDASGMVELHFDLGAERAREAMEGAER